MVSYGFGEDNHAFDAFTNEPGLTRQLAHSKRSDGAALGVSGALMEVVAFRRSSLLLSVDVNPNIGRVFLYFSAVLLAVDARARKQRWSDARRRLEVVRILRGDDTHRGLLQPLEALDVEPWIQREVRQMIYPVRASFQALSKGQPTWCTGPGAASRVLHLTELARRGRILSMSAELGDAKVVEVAERLTSALDLSFDHVHLSNALEYSPHVAELLGNLSRLPLTPRARLSLSAKHFAEASTRLRPETRRVIRNWGTFAKPAIRPAGPFLRAGDQLERTLWSDPVCGRHWTEMALRTIHPPLAQTDSRIAGSGEELDRWIDETFHGASRRVRRHWVREGLKRTGRWAIYRMLTDEKRLAQMPLTVPDHPNEVIASCALFDRQFWSFKRRKRAQARRLLINLGLSPAVIPDLNQQLEVCSRAEDLVALSWDIRQQSERDFHRWNSAKRQQCFEAVFDFYSKRPFRSIAERLRRKAPPIIRGASSLEDILVGAHELRLEYLSSISS